MIEEVGHDLRQRPEVQVSEAETATPSKSEQKTLAVSNQVTPHKTRRVIRAGIGGTGLVILVFVALASVIDPQNFFRIAAKRLEVSKHNLSQWVAFVNHQQAVPEKVMAKVEEEVETKRNQRVLIQHGSTIFKIVSDAYGANSLLALDIIKEFNPQIKNLNWVFPGQDLLLPPLTHETMLRKQPDGSYRLIVASFSSLAEADKYARLLGNAGYQVVITPKRVSDDLLLHRVEIDALKNFEEANQIWDTGLRNQWFAFVGNPTSGDR